MLKFILRCASIFCFQAVGQWAIPFQIFSLYSLHRLYSLYSLYSFTRFTSASSGRSSTFLVLDRRKSLHVCALMDCKLKCWMKWGLILKCNAKRLEWWLGRIVKLIWAKRADRSIEVCKRNSMGLLGIGLTGSFSGLIMSDNGQLWWGGNQPNYHNSAKSDKVKLELAMRQRSSSN